MAPIDLPYLAVFRSRARWFAYYRRDGMRRRLVGEDGKPVDPKDKVALAAAWQRAHQDHEAADRRAQDAAEARLVRPRSMADLITRYRESPDFLQRRPETRRDYEKGLRPLEADFGDRLVEGLRRHHVKQIRDRYAWRVLRDKAGRPIPDTDGREQRVANARQANRIVTMLSILMTYASDTLGWRDDNPASRPKRMASVGEGYRPWTQAEFVQFMQRADAEWRFAALLALLTAQRGQDQVTMTWAHYDGTGIAVAPQKPGAHSRIWVPVHKALKRELDARRRVLGTTPAPSLTLLDRDWRGRANAFQKAAGEAIRAAGLEGVVWHGLRGTAASWAGDGGASTADIAQLLNHATEAMTSRYRRGADQKTGASRAVNSIRVPRW